MNNKGSMQRTSEQSLWIALFLASTLATIEVIGGFWSSSLALISDAGHMATDVASLIIAILAIKIAKRKADTKRTFGYYRYEILAAVFNALILFLLAIYIFYHAYLRLFTPSPVQSVEMLAIAVLGLIINFISIRLLHTGSQHNLNVRAAYLEAWADMLGALGVVIAAIVIYTTEWYPIDSIVAILIGLWVLPRTWILLKESINILLEGVPEGIELDEINRLLTEIPGVLEVHDLHVWALTSGKISLMAHIVIDQTNKKEQTILKTATQLIEEKFKISHCTLQVEIESCKLKCS